MKSQVTDQKFSINPEKFGLLNEDQRFVMEVLTKAGYKIKWLSDKLNMDYEIVRYQISQAQNYRTDFHSRVLEVFKAEGLISSSKDATDKLKNELTEISEVLNRAVALMIRATKDRLPDGINPTEKKELKDILLLQRNRSMDAYNDLLLTVDMQ